MSDEMPEIVDQELLDANPALAEAGVEVGSPITECTEDHDCDTAHPVEGEVAAHEAPADDSFTPEEVI